MDIRKLQRAIVDGLEDVKGHDIAVFNTEALSPLFERVIIASGTSNRQTKALAASVRDTVKQRGMQVLRTEGEDNGEWIIVDCGAAVAHIMQPAVRDYYHLEEIWGGKNVRVKLGDGKAGLVKASTPDDDRPSRASTAKAKSTPKTTKTGKTSKTAAPAKAPSKAAPRSASKTAPRSASEGAPRSGQKGAAPTKRAAPARPSPSAKTAGARPAAGAPRKTAAGATPRARAKPPAGGRG